MARFQITHVKGPLFLVAILVFALFFGAYVPTDLKAFAFALSLTIKEILIFLLPALIFSFVFSSMVNLQKRALSFILLIIPLVCLSSFVSVWLAYFIGDTFLSTGAKLAEVSQSASGLGPLWSFRLPKLISNDYALFLGLALGLLCAYRFPKEAEVFSKRALSITHRILNHLFVPVMPLFILGFTLKLQHDQVLEALIQNYLFIFVIILGSAFGYLVLVYGALNGFRPKAWALSMQNMSSAVLAGFSTMSSAAAMPLTLLAGEKNTSKPEISRSVIPATVNIHLVGDCFATPIFAMAILISFGFGLPDLSAYSAFALYFVLAKFAVAAVPGGGILVMLPVLEAHLGFSGEMLSLITALYIIFDPVITAANVMGNGAFAMFFAKTFDWLEKTKKKPSSQT